MAKKKSAAARAEKPEAAPEKDAKKGKAAEEKPKGVVGTIRSVGPAVAVALVIRAFLFEPFSIPSGSMLPTLQIGDYVIVTKFAYGVRVPFTNVMAWQRRAPERGDVIVFDHPVKGGEDLIKRVVGLPGDEVKLVDGVVHVNGAPQGRELRDESYAFDDYSDFDRRWISSHGALFVERLEAGDRTHPHFVIQQQQVQPQQGPYLVPEGHVFVLGDNRDNSADSRSMATWYVPFGNIRGRADVIGFSWGPKKLRTDRIFRAIDAGVPGE